MKRLNSRMKRIEKQFNFDDKAMTEKEKESYINHQVKEIRRFLHDRVPYNELDLLEFEKNNEADRKVFEALTTAELRQIAGVDA